MSTRVSDRVRRGRAAELVRVVLRGRSATATLARDAILTFSLSIVSVALGLAVNVALARTLGIDRFGQYILAISWLEALVLVASLGFPVSLLKFMPSYRALEEWALLRGIVIRSYQIVLLAGAVIATVSLILAWSLRGGAESEQMYAVVIALAAVPVISLVRLQESMLRSFNRIVAARLLGLAIRPTLFLSTIGLVVLAGWTFKSYHAVLLSVASGALVAAAALLLVRRWMPEAARRAAPAFKTREWLRVSAPLFATSQIGALRGRGDLILIAVMLGPASVAIYAIAGRVARLASFGLTASTAVAAPLISELYTKNDMRELKRLVTLSVWSATVSSIVLALGLAVTNELILSVFGRDFLEASTILLIMLVSNVVNASTGPVGHLMAMTGRHDTVAKLSIGFAAIHLILVVPVILAGGLTALVLVGLLLSVVRQFLSWYIVYRQLHINSSVFGGLGPLLARNNE